jgi:hypothetical protein
MHWKFAACISRLASCEGAHELDTRVCYHVPLQAAVAVKQQQAVLKRALGNTQQGIGIFPAGIPAPGCGCSSTGLSQQSAGSPCTQLQPSLSSAPHPGSPGSPSHATGMQRSSSSPGNSCCAMQPAQARSSSRGTTSGSRGSQRLQPLDQKLAHRLVESCVDEVFAARAQPNMPDGSFNPALSLQQAAEYEAAREAADLERRLERGLVSALVLPAHCWASVLLYCCSTCV